jgi:hypothetical protein
MFRKQIHNLIHLALSLSLLFAPQFSHAENSLRLILETEVTDIDSTRFTIDFGEMTFSELNDLPAKLKGHADVLPKANDPLNVFVFVPASLPEAERDAFVESVQRQMVEAHPQLKIIASAVEIDTEKAKAQSEAENERIDSVSREILDQDGVDMTATAKALKTQNAQTAQELGRWSLGFKSNIAKYKNWIASGYTKEKDERVGGWIGKARGMASAAVWFGFNKASWATVFQIPASFFLDWFFSKYERKVDIFKGTHRLPGERIPLLGHVVRFYNERPLLKSWIVGNLIGFVAGNYFRFWSWMEDPQRTSAPWSADALATYGGAWSIGNLAGAYGAQGPRILRKKGYISSRTEYYIYVSYGMLFQLGGWFYGLGWNKAVLGMASAESIIKVGMYTYGRLRPFKEARAIAFHPALAEREVNELLYRVGLEKSEMTPVEKPDFAKIVSRLKSEQSVTWKQKTRALVQRALDKCESLLNSKN